MTSPRRWSLRLGAVSPDIADRVEGPIEQLPFPAAVFDAVAATGVLEYATNDLDGAVAELARVLTPRGVAIMSFPRQQSPALLWRSRVLYPSVRLVKRIVPFGGPAPLDLPPRSEQEFLIGREGRPGGRGDSEDRPLRLPRRRASAQAMKRIVVSLAVFAFGLVPGLSATAQTARRRRSPPFAGTGVDGHDGDGDPPRAPPSITPGDRRSPGRQLRLR